MLMILIIISQLVTNNQELIGPDLRNYLKGKLPGKIEYIANHEDIDEYLEYNLTQVEIDLMNSILTKFKFIDSNVLRSYGYFLEKDGNVDYVYEVYIKKYYGDQTGSFKHMDRELRKDFKRIKNRFDEEFDKLENGTEELPGYVISNYHRYVLKNIPDLQIEINAMTGGCLRTADIVLEYRMNVRSSN